MPIRTRILKAAGIVVSVVSGELSGNDLQANRARVQAELGDDTSFRLLFDARRAGGFPITTDQLRAFAGLGMPQARRFSHIAIVVPDDLSYGLARMYQGYASGYETGRVRIFRDLREGWHWLRAPGMP